MTTDSQPSEPAESTATYGGMEFKTVTLRILSPEEREEWNRNSPSFAQASLRRSEGSATD